MYVGCDDSHMLLRRTGKNTNTNVQPVSQLFTQSSMCLLVHCSIPKQKCDRVYQAAPLNEATHDGNISYSRACIDSGDSFSVSPYTSVGISLLLAGF